MQDIDITSCRALAIGRQGENLARTIRMDVRAMLSEWPDARIVLLVQREGDEAPYVAKTRVENGVLIFQPSAADTAKNGYGKMEIRAMRGEMIAKSSIIQMRVEKSIGDGETDPPEPEKPWVDQVIAAGIQAEESAQEAAESAGTAKLAADTAREKSREAEESARRSDEQAEAAEESARQAKETADRLSGLEAEAQTLEPGSPATVTVADGKIIYGIPSGETGEQGPPGADGKDGKDGKDGVQIDDAQITSNAVWSSRGTVDALCREDVQTGPIVQGDNWVAGYPLGGDGAHRSDAGGRGRSQPGERPADNGRGKRERDAVRGEHVGVW